MEKQKSNNEPNLTLDKRLQSKIDGDTTSSLPFPLSVMINSSSVPSNSNRVKTKPIQCHDNSGKTKSPLQKVENPNPTIGGGKVSAVPSSATSSVSVSSSSSFYSPLLNTSIPSPNYNVSYRDVLISQLPKDTLLREASIHNERKSSEDDSIDMPMKGNNEQNITKKIIIVKKNQKGNNKFKKSFLSSEDEMAEVNEVQRSTDLDDDNRDHFLNSDMVGEFVSDMIISDHDENICMDNVHVHDESIEENKLRKTVDNNSNFAPIQQMESSTLSPPSTKLNREKATTRTTTICGFSDNSNCEKHENIIKYELSNTNDPYVTSTNLRNEISGYLATDDRNIFTSFNHYVNQERADEMERVDGNNKNNNNNEGTFLPSKKDYLTTVYTDNTTDGDSNTIKESLLNKRHYELLNRPINSAIGVNLSKETETLTIRKTATETTSKIALEKNHQFPFLDTNKTRYVETTVIPLVCLNQTNTTTNNGGSNQSRNASNNGYCKEQARTILIDHPLGGCISSKYYQEAISIQKETMESSGIVNSNSLPDCVRRLHQQTKTKDYVSEYEHFLRNYFQNFQNKVGIQSSNFLNQSKYAMSSNTNENSCGTNIDNPEKVDLKIPRFFTDDKKVPQMLVTYIPNKERNNKREKTGDIYMPKSSISDSNYNKKKTTQCKRETKTDGYYYLASSGELFSRHTGVCLLVGDKNFPQNKHCSSTQELFQLLHEIAKPALYPCDNSNDNFIQSSQLKMDLDNILSFANHQDSPKDKENENLNTYSNEFCSFKSTMEPLKKKTCPDMHLVKQNTNHMNETFDSIRSQESEMDPPVALVAPFPRNSSSMSMSTVNGSATSSGQVPLTRENSNLSCATYSSTTSYVSPVNNVTNPNNIFGFNSTALSEELDSQADLEKNVVSMELGHDKKVEEIDDSSSFLPDTTENTNFSRGYPLQVGDYLRLGSVGLLVTEIKLSDRQDESSEEDSNQQENNANQKDIKLDDKIQGSKAHLDEFTPSRAISPSNDYLQQEYMTKEYDTMDSSHQVLLPEDYDEEYNLTLKQKSSSDEYSLIPMKRKSSVKNHQFITNKDLLFLKCTSSISTSCPMSMRAYAYSSRMNSSNKYCPENSKDVPGDSQVKGKDSLPEEPDGPFGCFYDRYKEEIKESSKCNNLTDTKIEGESESSTNTDRKKSNCKSEVFEVINNAISAELCGDLRNIKSKLYNNPVSILPHYHHSFLDPSSEQKEERTNDEISSQSLESSLLLCDRIKDELARTIFDECDWKNLIIVNPEVVDGIVATNNSNEIMVQNNDSELRFTDGRDSLQRQQSQVSIDTTSSKETFASAIRSQDNMSIDEPGDEVDLFRLHKKQKLLEGCFPLSEVAEQEKSSETANEDERITLEQRRKDLLLLDPRFQYRLPVDSKDDIQIPNSLNSCFPNTSNVSLNRSERSQTILGNHIDSLSRRGHMCYMCYEDIFTLRNPLIAACSCKGDTRYIHAECLQKWQTRIKITAADLENARILLQKLRSEGNPKKEGTDSNQQIENLQQKNDVTSKSPSGTGVDHGSKLDNNNNKDVMMKDEGSKSLLRMEKIQKISSQLQPPLATLTAKSQSKLSCKICRTRYLSHYRSPLSMISHSPILRHTSVIDSVDSVSESSIHKNSTIHGNKTNSGQILENNCKSSETNLKPLMKHDLPAPYICFSVVTKHEASTDLFNSHYQVSFNEGKEMENLPILERELKAKIAFLKKKFSAEADSESAYPQKSKSLDPSTLLQISALQEDIEKYETLKACPFPQIIVGRSRTCGMVLDYRTVSTQHACITYNRDTQQFLYQDLNSFNGTLLYLNNKLPLKLEYDHPYNIRVGKSLLRYRCSKNWEHDKTEIVEDDIIDKITNEQSDSSRSIISNHCPTKRELGDNESTIPNDTEDLFEQHQHMNYQSSIEIENSKELWETGSVFYEGLSKIYNISPLALHEIATVPSCRGQPRYLTLNNSNSVAPSTLLPSFHPNQPIFFHTVDREDNRLVQDTSSVMNIVPTPMQVVQGLPESRLLDGERSRQSFCDQAESINRRAATESHEEQQGRRETDMLIDYGHHENQEVLERSVTSQNRCEHANLHSTWQDRQAPLDSNVFYQSASCYAHQANHCIPHQGQSNNAFVSSNSVYLNEGGPFLPCNNNEDLERFNHLNHNFRWQNRASRSNSYLGQQGDTRDGMQGAQFNYYRQNSNENAYIDLSTPYPSYEQYLHQPYLQDQQMPLKFGYVLAAEPQSVGQYHDFCNNQQGRHHRYHEFNQGYIQSRNPTQNEIYHRRNEEESAQATVRQGYFPGPQNCPQLNFHLNNNVFQTTQFPTGSQPNPNGENQTHCHLNSVEVISNDETSLNTSSDEVTRR